MSIYKTEHVSANNRVVKYHESREDAIQYLNREAMLSWFNKISLKGMSNDKKADILLENLPTLNKRLEEIQELPKEYIEV